MNMKAKSASAAVLLLSLIGAAESNAALISNFDQPYGGGYGIFGPPIVATPFVTGASAYSVTSTTVSLANRTPYNFSVRMEIWATEQGRPSSAVGSFSILGLSYQLDFANYTALSEGILLMPNTQYWIVAGTLESKDSKPVIRAALGQAVDPGSIFQPGPTRTMSIDPITHEWTEVLDVDMTPYYSLDGIAVPEPSQSVMLLIGFGFALICRGHGAGGRNIHPRC